MTDVGAGGVQLESVTWVTLELRELHSGTPNEAGAEFGSVIPGAHVAVWCRCVDSPRLMVHRAIGELQRADAGPVVAANSFT